MNLPFLLFNTPYQMTMSGSKMTCQILQRSLLAAVLAPLGHHTHPPACGLMLKAGLWGILQGRARVPNLQEMSWSLMDIRAGNLHWDNSVIRYLFLRKMKSRYVQKERGY